MSKLSQDLSEFISGKLRKLDACLSSEERRIYRSLKSFGERAVRGMQVSECEFSVKFRGDVPTFLMLMEGKHAMVVGRQVQKRFEDHDGLQFVDVFRTKNGVKVVLRPKEEE